MSLPTTPEFLHAILRHLAAHADGDRRTIIVSGVADLLRLTQEQRNERTESGRPRHHYRTGWGLSMLGASSYVENPRSGFWRITDSGRRLLATFPELIDAATHRAIIERFNPAYGGGAEAPAAETTGIVGQGLELSPVERIDRAVDEINALLAKELLARILSMPPTFFEEFVLDLLHALGYGSTKSDLTHVGRTGDGGIDGLISLDRLGFEKIYVQAKRWQNPVGGAQVNEFSGALQQRRARRGVIVTTSSFTREARERASNNPDPIVLVDGTQLASLMIEHGVGVSHDRVVRLPRLDTDYFDIG